MLLRMTRKTRRNIPVPTRTCPHCGFIHPANLLRLDSANLQCLQCKQAFPSIPDSVHPEPREQQRAVRSGQPAVQPVAYDPPRAREDWGELGVRTLGSILHPASEPAFSFHLGSANRSVTFCHEMSPRKASAPLATFSNPMQPRKRTVRFRKKMQHRNRCRSWPEARQARSDLLHRNAAQKAMEVSYVGAEFTMKGPSA